MSVGGVSKPSTRRPHSSFTEKEAGPAQHVVALARGTMPPPRRAARWRRPGRRSHSKKPKKPTLSSWVSLWSRLLMAAMRPTTSLAALGEEVFGLAVLEEGILACGRAAAATSLRNGGTQRGSRAWSR